MGLPYHPALKVWDGGQDYMGLAAFELWDLHHSRGYYVRTVVYCTGTGTSTLENHTASMRSRAKPSWVASTPAPATVKFPKVTHLNKLTSSDLKGIRFLIEGIVSIPGEVRHPCYEELQQLGGRA